MALKILIDQPDSNITPLRIVVVLPTGLFGNFIKELKLKINGVGSVNPITKSDLPLQINKVYTFTYLGRNFEISEVLYKFINQRPANQEIYKTFSDYIRNSVVIFDEVHRLLRPVPGYVNTSLCKDMLDTTYAPQDGVMNSCIKFIAMTGTPLNKSVNDIKVMMSFISNNKKFEDIDNTEYSVIKFNDGVKIATFTEAKILIQTSIAIFMLFCVYFPVGDVLKNLGGQNATIILGLIITTCLNLINKFGGGEDGTDSTIPENQLVNYINSQIDDYLKTKDVNHAINLFKQIGKTVNVNEIIKFSGITGEGLLEITKAYLSVYGMILNTNGKIDINKAYSLSKFFIADKADIIGMADMILNGGSLNSSAILHSSTVVLSNLLPKIVFKEEDIIYGGKGKKTMKGGQLGIMLQAFLNPVAGAFAKGLLSVPKGFQEAVEKNPLNPSYTFCQNVNSWFGIGLPFDIVKFSNDVREFISISDSSIQDGLVKETYEDTYQVDRFKEIINNQSTLEGERASQQINYLKETPKFYSDVLHSPIKSNYPKKIECCLEFNYQPNQLQFYRTFNSDNLKESTKQALFGADFNILTASKIVGNYSDDVLRYKCIYQAAESKYSYTYLTAIEEQRVGQTLNTLEPWTFGCTKFNNVLANLLFMRTGYMKCYKEFYKSQNYIVSQPHFTDSLGEMKEDGQIPKLKPIIKAPYAITDKKATFNYLPIVYSTSDNLGLGLFAGFLDSLGFKYILIHDLDKKNLDNKKLKSYMPVPMGNEKFTLLPGVNNDANKEVEKHFQDILTNIRGKAVDSYDKGQPICVLLHNAMTEGIDFKFNPGIFLLEVPNTYGDYEQLCGRVLRTYSTTYNKNWKEYIEKNNPTVNDKEFIKRWKLPIKVVYQSICLTGIDRLMLTGEKIGDSEDEKKSQSQIRTSSYRVPDISGSSNSQQPILSLVNETWGAKIYNNASFLQASFKSPDVRQWFDLITQKSLFKRFITVLNTSSNTEEPEFTGLTDLQEIIKCVPDVPDVPDVPKLSEPMCKQIPGKLTNDKYNTIRTELYMENGLQKFKKTYCLGEQVKNFAQRATIEKVLNPQFIEAKKNIQIETNNCLTTAGEDETEIEKCKVHEKNQLQSDWNDIKKDLPQLQGTRAPLPRAVNAINGGKKTKKQHNKNKKTHKRKKIIVKKKITRRVKHRLTKKR